MPDKIKMFYMMLITFFSILVSKSTKAQWTASPPINDEMFRERPFGFQFMDTLTIFSGYVAELSSFFVLYGIMSYFLTAKKERKLNAKKTIHYSLTFLVISLLIWVFTQLLFIDP